MKLKNLFIAALAFIAASASAQQETMQMPAMPVDSAVIVGHLDNGLTYYIRKNNYPAGKVNFYIAHKVGAIQEEDNQDGLAHLLEHMAFNGSKHFKDDSVVKFMDSIGGQWNAYTTADHTVYFITGVGNERQSVIDSCLLVLSDWSEGLTLTADQIETERDVVHNEYRGHNAMQRLMRASNADLFPGSIYGKRTVIGSMDVIDKCNPETLRAYYRKWYFPGNQAVIVVGDINPKEIEASIKKMFGQLPVEKGATKATDVAIADNEKTLYSFGSDKEVTQNIYQLYRKLDVVTPEEKNSLFYLVQQAIEQVSNMMFNNRLQKIAATPESSLLMAQAETDIYAGHARTRRAQTVVALPKPGKEKEALKEIIRELNRIGQFGFTPSEYKLAMETYKTTLEKLYNNRATIKNDTYAQKLIQNFISAEPYPTIEQQYAILGQVIPMLPLYDINKYAKSVFNTDEKNFAVSAIMQEKNGKPAFVKADMPTLIAQARNEKVEPMPDDAKEEPLMTKEPVAGKIVSEKPLDKFGAKELTLSNGAKVILKKTDLKANEIMMMATAAGGTSIVKNENVPMRKAFEMMMPIHGLGTKGVNDLINIGQAKQTSVSVGVSNDLHYLDGQTINENIELLMQMINLNFTGIKKDEAFYQLISQAVKGQLSVKHNSPEQVMEDSLAFYTHNKQLDKLSLDEKDFDNISYDRIMELRNQLFANAGEFTFVFVGSFDEATIRPLIEKYIASLPADKRKSDLEDSRNYTNGKLEKSFTMKMANPQSITNDLFRSDKVEYTLENSLNAKALGQILWNKMFEIIRERESAVYTPMPSARLENDLNGNYFTIECELASNPDKTVIAGKLAKEIINDAQTNITTEDIAKVREAISKSHADAIKTNGYWLDVLSDYAIYGIDKATGFDATLKALSPQSIGNVVKQVLKTGNHVRVILNAEKE